MGVVGIRTIPSVTHTTRPSARSTGWSQCRHDTRIPIRPRWANGNREALNGRSSPELRPESFRSFLRFIAPLVFRHTVFLAEPVAIGQGLIPIHARFREIPRPPGTAGCGWNACGRFFLNI